MKLSFKFLQMSCWIFLAGQNAFAGDVAPERIVWNKKPIAVHIEQGSERIIHFPSDIRYWLPSSLNNKVIALAANGVLYIQARDSFPTTRIRVQDIASQQVYLLDVTANDQASVSDELIVMEPQKMNNLSKPEHEQPVGEDWRVRLTRHAAQQLYAPERVLLGDPAIKRIHVNTNDPIPLIQGGQFTAMPIAAWQGGGYYLTAVRVVNQTPNKMPIQFGEVDSNALSLATQLRGDWLAVAPQHTYVGPHGTTTDTTVLYLVSERPFAESFDFAMVNDDG